MSEAAKDLLLVVGDDPLGRQLAAALETFTRPPEDQGADARRLLYGAQSRAAREPVPDLADFEAEVWSALANHPIEELILVSSTQVFEPSHRHLSMTAHTDLPIGEPSNLVAIAWRRLESLARKVAEERGIGLVILRVAPMIVEGGRDFWSRLFRRRHRIAFTYPGYDPTLQLLPVDDLIRALVALASRRGRSPQAPETVSLQTLPRQTQTLHLAPTSNVPLRKALRCAGVLRIPVPRFVQSLLRSRVSLHQVDYLRHPFTVDGEPTRRRLGLGEPPRAADEPSHDRYGLDRDYIRRLSKTLFRFLHDVWWRVDVRGLEHLPAEGSVVLVGIHRGFQPWDGVMAMQHIAGKTGRHVRFLTHPTLLKFPYLAPYMQKLGGVPAASETADRVLGEGQVLAIFPEGIRGAFLKYGPDIYRPCRFMPDFVAFALRHQAPIVPFVSVGPAEIYPIWKKLRWRWWCRVSEWPCLPVTPTLGTVPLPSKWHTRYLPALRFEHPPEAADDVRLVRRLSNEVRETMASALGELVSRRRHIFWGDLK